MRQIKNCKVGHFVRYQGVLCQVNCFFTGCINGYKAKQATLIQVGEPGEKKRMYTPRVEEKVEYIGAVARENGRIWIRTKPVDPFLDG